ncbi:MAG: energy-coupling factor ABC transporter permease [Coriobacteriia bacterium]|nr:energy-coupling factor ABC transporter permease [Coriobacteriia bacterium]
MSHIHIPDGVLPWWLWLGGWLLALGMLAVASRMATGAGSRRAVPLIGAVSALVLVSMASEIVPLAYHINLTVIAGVLLGPWLGTISAFIVVLVLALLGHGGATVVGLNTLVIATEMTLGWALVRGGLRLLGHTHVRPVAAVSTVITLAITTTMLVGIVALAGTGATARETGALDAETLEFRNPFGDGVFTIGLLGDGHDHAGETEEEHAAHADDARGETGGLSVERFAAVVYTLGPFGWVLEALVTAAILGYVARVRPSLVYGTPAAEYRVRYGDEHGGH